MASIRLNGITKRWGKVTGVSHFDLEVADQEFIVFLGPSGCGKTTTMRMIAGLEDPSDGDIMIGDTRVNNLDPKDRDVAMVFQSYGLYPNLTVYENIRFPLKVRKANPATHDDRVNKAADMVELGNLLHRYPRELSGGQRQRVALARAIVREPNVFLMDEPLSNLDAKLRVSTRAKIKHLQHTLKTTTIYVTHDQIEAMTLADRVVVMNKGKLQQLGTPKQIYDRPANTFVASFIGSPAMNLLPGRIEQEHFVVGDIRIPAVDVQADGDITLGFRAEDVEVTLESDATLVAPVYSVELLGDATLVTLNIDGTLLAAKASKDFEVEMDQQVGFRLAPESCHWFDATTGHRIDG